MHTIVWSVVSAAGCILDMAAVELRLLCTEALVKNKQAPVEEEPNPLPMSVTCQHTHHAWCTAHWLAGWRILCW